MPNHEWQCGHCGSFSYSAHSFSHREFMDCAYCGDPIDNPYWEGEDVNVPMA